MSAKQTAINWLITLAIGSFLAPYIWLLADGFNWNELDQANWKNVLQGAIYFLGFSLYIFILAIVSSIVSMAILILINAMLEPKFKSNRSQIKASMYTSVSMIFCTAIIIGAVAGMDWNEIGQLISAYVLGSLVFHNALLRRKYHKPQVLNFPS